MLSTGVRALTGVLGGIVVFLVLISLVYTTSISSRSRRFTDFRATTAEMYCIFNATARVAVEEQRERRRERRMAREGSCVGGERLGASLVGSRSRLDWSWRRRLDTKRRQLFILYKHGDALSAPFDLYPARIDGF